jgi:hypothetical protein
VAHEVGPDDDDPGLGVGDDLGHLRRRQAPVHRDVDGVELGEAERDVEELQAVLVDEGHAVAGPDARGPQSLGHPRRALVELAEGDRAPGDLERRSVRPPGRVDPDDVGERTDGREISGAGSVGSGHEVVPPRVALGPR